MSQKEVTANLHDCKHCSGTGTCTSGVNGTSCLVCAKKAELPFWQRFSNQTGLACGSCSGLGLAEPFTERLNKRVAPVLAVVLVFLLCAMIMITLIMDSPHFTAVLAFASATIGSVVGFYFSNKNMS